jgi:PPOX class probable FMN-dependent enzyme
VQQSEAAVIDDEGELRSLYRDPGNGVRRKSIDHVDEGAAGFLAATTLAVLATAGPTGADASPRGGPPGFLRVLNPQQVGFGDLAGNNRLDTYANLTSVSSVGMLCIVPGVEETLRINGRASISTEADVLAAVALDGRTPKVAIVIDVDECYIHCAQALRRAGIWDVATWPEDGARPSPAAILTKHLDLDVDPALVEADLGASYVHTLWEHGGT